jgi:hypothetical protein
MKLSGSLSNSDILLAVSRLLFLIIGYWARLLRTKSELREICRSETEELLEVKLKFTLEQATKTQRGSRGITLLFF